jgi:hypothetical protein
LLHPNFWRALYITCCGINSNLAIIDCSGAWLTPFIVAMSMEVLYFNIKYIANYFIALKVANFSLVIELVSNNASSDDIIKFILVFKKFKQHHIKKLKRKIQVLSFLFVVTLYNTKRSI